MNSVSAAKSRGLWYLVVQIALMALVAFGPSELPGMPRWGKAWRLPSLLCGSVLGGAGLILGVFALITLGPQNLTAFPRPPNGGELVMKGPYAVIRHPIYGAAILIALGWGLARCSSLILIYALILLLFLDFKARQEEHWLLEKFPEYRCYQRTAKRLFPYIY